MAYNYIRYSLGKHALQLNALVLRKKHLINAGYSFTNWSFIVAWGYVICYIFKTSKKNHSL
jgi:amino acid transporter